MSLSMYAASPLPPSLPPSRPFPHLYFLPPPLPPSLPPSQLNTILAKRTKFICLNDDVKATHFSHDTFGLLQHFFLSVFPQKGQFELPLHLENR